MEDNRRRRLLGGWGRWSAEHWRAALLIALGITVLMAVGMTRLRLEMTFYSLLPDGSKQVRDLKTIEEQFPVASSIVVVVAADQNVAPQQARRTVVRAVDELAEELSGSEYSQYIVRVQSKMDQGFFREHGLLASQREDIERMRRVFADLNLVPLFRHLNDDFEREYSGNDENLKDDEQMVTAQVEGLEQLLATMELAASRQPVSEQRLSASLDRFLFGSPYFLNRDGTMALLFIQPGFTINDIENYVEFIPRLGMQHRLHIIDGIESEPLPVSVQHLVLAQRIILIVLAVMGRPEDDLARLELAEAVRAHNIVK